MSKTTKMVVFCNASSITGISNFGDELLSQLYARWIHESDPSVTVNKLSVNSFGLLSRRTKRLIRDSCGIIFTGGGYFADDDVESGKWLRRHLRALRNRNVYWNVFQYGLRFDKPCAVIGLEVGPLTNPFYRDAVRNILLKAKEIVVRNEKSRANVLEICDKPLEVGVHLDAALTLSADDGAQSHPRVTTDLSDTASDEFRMGLHVHSVQADVNASDIFNIVTTITSNLAAGKMPKMYYVHDQRKKGNHPSRSQEAESVIVDSYPETRVVPYKNPSLTIAAIRKMDLIVTTKLHVGIVARALGIPVIALGKHFKIKRFYQEIGEEWARGRPEDFTVDTLPIRLKKYLVSEGNTTMPIDDEFRESAVGSRDVMRRFVSSL